MDFGEGKKNIVALEGARVLLQNETELPFAVRNGCEVQMAVKEFGKGRGVYISGLPYSFKNSRVLYRAVLWAASAEAELHKWFSTNYNVEVHAYVKNGKYCVVNNTYEPQDTTVYVATAAGLTCTWSLTKLSGIRFNRHKKPAGNFSCRFLFVQK